MIDCNSIEFGYKKSFSHFFFLIYTKIRFSQKLQFLIVVFHRLIRRLYTFSNFCDCIRCQIFVFTPIRHQIAPKASYNTFSQTIDY